MKRTLCLLNIKMREFFFLWLYFFSIYLYYIRTFEEQIEKDDKKKMTTQINFIKGAPRKSGINLQSTYKSWDPEKWNNFFPTKMGKGEFTCCLIYWISSNVEHGIFLAVFILRKRRREENEGSDNLFWRCINIIHQSKLDHWKLTLKTKKE